MFSTSRPIVTTTMEMIPETPSAIPKPASTQHSTTIMHTTSSSSKSSTYIDRTSTEQTAIESTKQTTMFSTSRPIVTTTMEMIPETPSEIPKPASTQHSTTTMHTTLKTKTPLTTAKTTIKSTSIMSISGKYQQIQNKKSESLFFLN